MLRTTHFSCQKKIPKTSLILWLCIFSFFHSNSQNAKIDSLVSILPTLPQDTSRVNMLNKLSWEFHRTDIEQTFHYGRAALKLGEELDYPAGIARALNLLAIGYMAKGHSDKAVELNERCLAISDSIKHDYLISCATNDLGILYSQKGDSEKALAHLQRSLRIAEALNDTLGQCFSLINIGHIHHSNQDFDEATAYYLAGVEIGKTSTDPMVQAVAYKKLGLCFADMGEYEKAIENYELGYTIAEKAGDKNLMSAIKLKMGFVHLDKGLEELAVQYAISAIQIAADAGDNEMLVSHYHDLANIYHTVGLFEQSLESNQLSLQLAKKFGLKKLEKSIYHQLSATYAELKDYKKAYEYHQMYSMLGDSLLSKAKMQHIAELEKKYQTEKKEDENTFLKVLQKEQNATIKKQQSLALALGVIALLLGGLGFTIYRAYRSKNASHLLLERKVEERTQELQRLNNNLKKSNDELERFAYIASHDLKEPLRNISSFAKLLEYELNIKPDSKEYDYISFIVKNIKQMNTLIEDVLEYSKVNHDEDSFRQIDLNQIIEDIKFSLSNTLHQKSASVLINNELPHIYGQSSKMFFLFKNLIENGIKYNDNECPEINIQYQKDLEYHTFSITDNGIGIEKEYFNTIFQMFKRLHSRQSYEGTGLGLSLCKKIVTDIGGEIWLDSEFGTGSTFYFSIPINQLMETDTAEIAAFTPV